MAKHSKKPNTDHTVPQDRPPTLEDLGTILGLSKRAVSQALHDRPGTVKVSKATKERVLTLAKSLGYRPNTAAKSLTTGRTGMYAIFASIGQMHISAVHLRTAIQAFRKYQVTPLVIHARGDDPAELDQCITSLINSRVDAVLMLNSPMFFNESHLKELKRYGMSMVQVGAKDPIGTITHYCVDWTKAYEPALFHLLEQGYRKITGLILLDSKNATNSGQRTRTSMLEAANVARNQGAQFQFEIHSTLSGEKPPEDLHPLYHQGYLAMKDIIRRNQLPEAIMFQMDGAALGAMRACQEAGIRIPEDVAMTGFSNEPVCSASYIPLTSLQFPIEEMCEQAVAELTQAAMTGKQTEAKSVEFTCKLVPRLSSQRRKPAA